MTPLAAVVFSTGALKPMAALFLYLHYTERARHPRLFFALTWWILLPALGLDAQMLFPLLGASDLLAPFLWGITAACMVLPPILWWYVLSHPGQTMPNLRCVEVREQLQIERAAANGRVAAAITNYTTSSLRLENALLGVPHG